MNETGSYPGQPWLWLYTLWYQVPGFDNSANVDLIAIYLTGCGHPPAPGSALHPGPARHPEAGPGAPGSSGASGTGAPRWPGAIPAAGPAARHPRASPSDSHGHRAGADGLKDVLAGPASGDRHGFVRVAPYGATVFDPAYGRGRGRPPGIGAPGATAPP